MNTPPSALPGVQAPRSRAPQLLFIALSAAIVVSALFARSWLPERFLMDDALIQAVAADDTLVPSNRPFHAIAALYRVTGLVAAPPLQAMLSAVLLVLAIWLAVPFDRVGELRPGALLVLTACGFVGVVYLAQFSKEIVTLGVVLVVLAMGRSQSPDQQRTGGAVRWRNDLLVVALCLGYAWFMRPYWVIVAAAYLGLRWLLPRITRPRRLLLLPLGAVPAYAVLGVALHVAQGQTLDGWRSWLNGERVNVEVSTLIANPLPGGGPLGQLAGTLLVALQLVVPLPLLSAGTLYALGSGLLILAVWAVALAGIARGAGRLPAAALVVAVLFVQGVFEPDYGSYLKHLAPLLPLMLACAAEPRRSAAVITPGALPEGVRA